MLQKVVLPQLGQTMEEGTVEKWHKAEGDTVEKGEVLFDLTTDKATLEVESFAQGVLKKILVKEGETVPVNALVALIGDPEDEVPDDLSELTGEEPEEESAAAAEVATGEAEVEAAPAASASTEPRGRIFASPRARKIAEEQRVPLSVLQGSGPEGRIIERDVEGYLEELEDIRFTPTAREVAFQEGVDLRRAQGDGRITREDVEEMGGAAGAGEVIELSAMRQTIAQRMAESKQSVPHFYLIGQVTMDAAEEMRAELNAEEKKVSVTGLLIKAAGLALEKHPRVNAQFRDGSIALNERCNVGVAVAVEDGLFVPVVRDAEARGIAEISSDLKELAASAREGTLIPEQYEGGSLTLSNLGMFDVDYFLPIINPPESCILGIGKLTEEVVAHDGAITIEKRMKVSLSADHRVVDGAEAAKFFKTFQELLENPESLVE